MSGYYIYLAREKHIGKQDNIIGVFEKKKIPSKTKVMFGNSFCFLFSKTYFLKYKEKTIFLYFWNQKHVWLVEIKKIVFWKKERKENTKICCY